MAVTAQFAVYSTDLDGNILCALPFRDLQAEFRYSREQGLRFTFPFSNLKQLSKSVFWPGKTEVTLVRNGKKIFAGPLWDVSINSGEDRVSCGVGGIETYFSKRLVNISGKYSGSYGDAAWKAISYSQSLPGGNLNIRRGRGVGAGAPSGTLKWRPHIELSKALEDMYQGTKGFDWVITPDRVYNQYYPRINEPANCVLEYGYNIRNYSVNYSGKYESNRIIATGKESSFSAPVIDTNMRSFYGLRETVVNNSSLVSKQALNALANSELKMRRQIKVTPQISVTPDGISPFDGAVSYGQMVPVVIKNGWDDVEAVMRCTGFQLTIGQNYEETYVLYLNDDREVTD